MKKIFTLILSTVILSSVSVNAGAQTFEQSFTKGSNRVYAAVGLPAISIGTFGLSGYGAYERGIFAADAFVIGAGVDLEVGAENSTMSISTEAILKTHYKFSSRFDVAVGAGLGYGRYGHIYSLTRSVSMTGVYAVTSKLSAIADLSLNSIPGRGALKLGVAFSL